MEPNGSQCRGRGDFCSDSLLEKLNCLYYKAVTHRSDFQVDILRRKIEQKCHFNSYKVTTFRERMDDICSTHSFICSLNLGRLCSSHLWGNTSVCGFVFIKQPVPLQWYYFLPFVLKFCVIFDFMPFCCSFLWGRRFVWVLF